MKLDFRRSHWALGTCVLAASMAGGCGMVTAVTNPSAAFAIQEPANLGVVVRRAEIARATSEQVDRLLGSTALSEDAAWLGKVALETNEATNLMKAAASENVYAGSQAKIVPAEAWAHGLANLCGEGSAHANLVAASGPSTAKLYAEIVAEKKAILKLTTAAAAQQKVADADGVAADKKAAAETKAAQLEAEIDMLEAANEAKVEQLTLALKRPSSAAGALKGKLVTVVANLNAAVKDARNANSAAMLGYPMALSGISGEVQKAAPRFVADVIEDRTGTRPDVSSLKPDVKLEGTDVKLTLNGLTTEQLGSLDLADVIKETTLRLSGYAGRILSLTVYASETQDLLSLQAELLEAYLEGLGGGGAPVDLSTIQIAAAAPGAKPAAKAEGAPKGKRMEGGLLIASACTPKDEDKTVIAAAVAAPTSGEPTRVESEPAAEKPVESTTQQTANTAENKPATRGGSALKTVGFISLATGGAGLIAGGVFGIIAAGKHNDLAGACEGTNCPPELHGEVASYRSMATVSTAALIGGGAAAAAGLVLIVAAPSAPKGPGQEQSKPKPSVVPYVGLGTAGAMGRF
jgi:hypothetical protein